MPATLVYPHIEKIEGRPARLQRMPRIRVAQIVMDYLYHGWSPDTICENYPHLQRAETYAAMAYYFDHKEEIDAEIKEETEEADADRERAKATSLLPTLLARMQQKRSG